MMTVGDQKLPACFPHDYLSLHTNHMPTLLLDDDDDDDSDGSEESTARVLSSKEMESLYQGGNKEVWKKVIAPPPLNRAPRKEPHFGTLFWCDDIPASLYAFWESKTGGLGPSSSTQFRVSF